MKGWIKKDAEVSRVEKPELPAKSTLAYAREYGEDGKQAQLTEALKEMTKAHNKSSASNKTIRNGFYGKKD